MTNVVKRLIKEHRFIDESFLTSCHPKIRDFYEYWRSKCSDDALPGRQDIAPEEMIPFLSGITLVEKDKNGELRYRLVGTMEVEMRGFDPTGQLVQDGQLATNGYVAMDNYDKVLSTNTLIYEYGEFIDYQDKHLVDEVIFLPLARDHKTADMVIVFATVHYMRDKRAFDGR